MQELRERVAKILLDTYGMSGANINEDCADQIMQALTLPPVRLNGNDYVIVWEQPICNGMIQSLAESSLTAIGHSEYCECKGESDSKPLAYTDLGDPDVAYAYWAINQKWSFDISSIPSGSAITRADFIMHIANNKGHLRLVEKEG